MTKQNKTTNHFPEWVEGGVDVPVHVAADFLFGGRQWRRHVMTETNHKPHATVVPTLMGWGWGVEGFEGAVSTLSEDQDILLWIYCHFSHAFSAVKDNNIPRRC